MPDPIRTSTSNVHAQTLRDLHATSHTRDEEKRAQASPASVLPLLVPVAAEALEAVVHHVAHQQIEHAVLDAAKALGGVTTRLAEKAEAPLRVYGQIKLYAEATAVLKELACGIAAERGHRLAEAAAADQARLAEALIVNAASPPTLPPGYVAAEARRVAPGPGGVSMRSAPFVLASDVTHDADAGQPEARRLVAELRAAARAGVDEAVLLGIGATVTLEQAMSWPDFAARFRHDPGFELGVRAAAWQAAHDPAGHAEAQRTAATSLEVRHAARPA